MKKFNDSVKAITSQVVSEQLLTDLQDVCASGEGGEIAANKWQVQECQKLLKQYGKQPDKLFYQNVKDWVQSSDGFYADDVRFLLQTFTNMPGAKIFKAVKNLARWCDEGDPDSLCRIEELINKGVNQSDATGIENI